MLRNLGLLGLLLATAPAAEPPPEPARVRTRTCGGCTACCTTLGNTELEPAKPTFTPCPHQCEKGCGIQETKPSGCATFNCLWLQDTGKMFTDSERPDILGVVCVGEITNLGPTIRVWEHRVGALADNRVVALIQRWATGLAVVGVPHGDGQRKLWAPDRIVALAKELMAAQ
jgi:hypothetical protein